MATRQNVIPDWDGMVHPRGGQRVNTQCVAHGGQQCGESGDEHEKNSSAIWCSQFIGSSKIVHRMKRVVMVAHKDMRDDEQVIPVWDDQFHGEKTC